MSGYVSGLWKFQRPKVTEREILDCAREFAEDEKYLYIFIRGASKTQTAIGFVYELKDDSESTLDKFQDEMADILYKKFGNGFVGWDYSNGVVFLKGFGDLMGKVDPEKRIKEKGE